jgi:hypothetical protein
MQTELLTISYINLLVKDLIKFCMNCFMNVLIKLLLLFEIHIISRCSHMKYQTEIKVQTDKCKNITQVLWVGAEEANGYGRRTEGLSSSAGKVKNFFLSISSSLLSVSGTVSSGANWRKREDQHLPPAGVEGKNRSSYCLIS